MRLAFGFLIVVDSSTAIITSCVTINSSTNLHALTVAKASTLTRKILSVPSLGSLTIVLKSCNHFCVWLGCHTNTLRSMRSGKCLLTSLMSQFRKLPFGDTINSPDILPSSNKMPALSRRILDLPSPISKNNANRLRW